MQYIDLDIGNKREKIAKWLLNSFCALFLPLKEMTFSERKGVKCFAIDRLI